MKLWAPTKEKEENAELQKFMNWLSEKKGVNFSSFDELYQWSIKKTKDFWTFCFEYFNLYFEGNLEMKEESLNFIHYAWFPHVKMNFAENLLLKGEENQKAIHFVHESGFEKTWTYGELKKEVFKLSHYLSDWINQGEVVAAYMPNCGETVIGMLATSVLGGVFTSTSCDFGVEGVCSRFGESRPKVLIAASSYTYNGKVFSQREKVEEILKRVDSIKKVIWVDFLEEDSWGGILDRMPETQVSFIRRGFAAPQYIMYSSGTTGKPKCIVHSQGGTLLQHLKELVFHSNLNASKSLCYFTTCGWMMWNWQVSTLATGGSLVLYEGSPAYPSLSDFMKVIDKNKVHLWGTSPKFLRALELSSYDKNDSLDSLEVILSTGAPLLPDQFDFVYKKIKEDIQLASISGGTDIIGCFMLGNPIAPVYRGEIQTRGLGMAVESFGDKGRPIRDHEGELVCLKSFPSQPIEFLGDEKKERYKKSYFSKFGEEIWCHGDYITINQRGGIIVHGRSDATLNPGGVRIGTAEIYEQVEKLDFIDDSLCVGKREKGDISIVLFVKLKNKESILTDEQKKLIQKKIVSETTPRHKPKYIYQIGDIPYTRSGKKMELVITRLLDGQDIVNKEAIANPECLGDYRALLSS